MISGGTPYISTITGMIGSYRKTIPVSCALSFPATERANDIATSRDVPAGILTRISLIIADSLRPRGPLITLLRKPNPNATAGQAMLPHPCGFDTRAVEAGNFASFSAGRIGRATRLPPQFGQRPSSLVSAQVRQNAHSNEQIIASVAAAGRSLS